MPSPAPENGVSFSGAGDSITRPYKNQNPMAQARAIKSKQ